MRRKKKTLLEEQIFQAWETQTFPPEASSNRNRTFEESIVLTQIEMPKFMAILKMAYDGSDWIVDSHTAIMVSGSVWHRAMLLGYYDLAEETIERCLSHAEPFKNLDSAILLSSLKITRFVRDPSPEAAKALQELIDCGIRKPSLMAKLIYHYLSTWIEPFHDDGRESRSPVSEEARSLALALATARRAGKRLLKSAADIQTWEDFGRHITASAGFELYEPESLSSETPRK